MLYLTQTSVNPGLGSTGVSPVVSPGVSPVSTIAPMTLNPCTTSLAFTPGGGNTALTLNTVPQGSTMAPGSIMHLINYGDKDLGLLLSQRWESLNCLFIICSFFCRVGWHHFVTNEGSLISKDFVHCILPCSLSAFFGGPKTHVVGNLHFT